MSHVSQIQDKRISAGTNTLEAELLEQGDISGA